MLDDPLDDAAHHAATCNGLPTFDTDLVGHWSASCTKTGCNFETTGNESRREAGARFYGGEQPGLYGQIAPPAAVPVGPNGQPISPCSMHADSATARPGHEWTSNTGKIRKGWCVGGGSTVRMTNQISEPLEHLGLNATNRPAEFFVRAVEKRYMDLNPEYQRGDVWTNKQRMGLVYSWMAGLPIPAVVINDRSSRTWRSITPQDPDVLDFGYAVIDGKQRILTAIAWFGGELAVPASWFPTDHIETTEPTEDGPYVRMTGLTRMGQRFAENHCVLPCAEARLPTVAAEAQVYLLVNGGGTPQTPLDMDNAARVASGRP